MGRDRSGLITEGAFSWMRGFKRIKRTNCALRSLPEYARSV